MASGNITININVQGVENLQRFVEGLDLLLEESEGQPWNSSLRDILNLFEKYYKNLMVKK